MKDAPPCRVLVVDDYPDTPETLAIMLRLWGHDVRIARDGPTALALAEVYCPQVILLDIAMPGMDGYEVARRLRQRPALAKTLIVTLSGYGRAADFRLANDAGCDCHLVKPVEPETLHRMLTDCHEPRAARSTPSESAAS